MSLSPLNCKIWAVLRFAFFFYIKFNPKVYKIRFIAHQATPVTPKRSGKNLPKALTV